MIEFRPIGVEQYAERHSKPMSLFHDKLWLETYRKTGNPTAMVGPLAGQFLKMLVLMTGARRILEVGMYTGYSTLAFAEALPKDGRIVTCEINAESTEIARQCFAESPHGRKIEVREVDLRRLLNTLQTGINTRTITKRVCIWCDPEV